MSWAGINNTFFWIDPQAELGVVVLMQMLPFYDETALDVLRGVEARLRCALSQPGRWLPAGRTCPTAGIQPFMSRLVPLRAHVGVGPAASSR